MRISEGTLAAHHIQPLGLRAPHLEMRGGFADVYRAHDAQGTPWAVRFHAYPELERLGSDVYQAFEARSATLPAELVPTKWHPHGAVDPRATAAAVVSPWTDGISLGTFVGRRKYGRSLRSFIDIWPEVPRRLRAAGISHRDLSMRNVQLVFDAADVAHTRATGVRLFDLDTAFTAGLEAVPLPRVGQFASYGSRGFVHPQTWAEGAAEPVRSINGDGFAATIVQLTAEAVEADADLLRQVNAETLHIIGDGDLAAVFLGRVETSLVFSQLLRSPEPRVRRLTECVIGICQDLRHEDAPELDTVLSAVR